MPDVLTMLMDAFRTTFALFARKLILSGEIIAIVGMVGWRLDARLGVAVWPQDRAGLQRISDLLAAGVTLALVLYVAFLRDYADLGAQHEFTRYCAQCVAVIAGVAILAAAASWFRSLVEPVGLLVLLATTTVGLVIIDSVLKIAPESLARIGGAFRVDGPVRALHGLAAILTGALFVALGVRVLRARGRPLRLGAWDIFLAFALAALVQGFLAYRGVSALFILAAASLVAWRWGWRTRASYRDECLTVTLARASEGLTLMRAPAPTVAQASEGPALELGEQSHR